MPSILRYPSKVQNIEGNNIPYRSCDHIENITNDLNTVGHWGYADPGAKYKNAIAGRNGSRKHPSTIRGYDFKYEGLIPDSAKVTSIIVQYSYRKLAYSAQISQTAHGSFSNPEIILSSLNLSKTGNAPPRNNFGEYEVQFNNLNLKGKDINTPNFDVKFDLPQNTSTNPCYIEMKYLRVIVVYTTGNYIPSISIEPNIVSYGEKVAVKCTMVETSGTKPSEEISANIKIITNGDCEITYDSPYYDWTTGIWRQATTNGKAELIFYVTPTSEGLFTITLDENNSGHSTKTTFVVEKPQLEVWDFYANNKEIEISTDTVTDLTYLNITLKTDAPLDLTLNLNFGGLTVKEQVPGLSNNILQISKSQWQKDDSGNIVWDTNIPLYSKSSGEHNIEMTSPLLLGVFTDKVKVNIPDSYKSYYSVLNLSEFTLSNLEHGETYVFSALGRLLNASKIEKGLKNLRVCVVNGTTNSYTNQISVKDIWEELSCEFTYDASKPIYLIFYGNFIDFDYGTVEFGNLSLILKERYAGYEYPVLALSPKRYLLGDVGSTANLLLEPPELALSTKHFFEGFNWQGLENNNVLIHGIEITGDISVEESINLICGVGTLDADELDYYLDSINITRNDTNFKFGGKFHNFGIPFPEINTILNDLRFFLQIDDAFDNVTPFQVEMKNVQITVYYSKNSGEDCDFYINGVSCKYFLISMSPETEIPRGANFDTEKYKIEGADGKYPIRVNVDNKKIKLKFRVYGDDFEESTEIMKYVSDYLYPERDTLDSPILKNISFFFAPEECFDYYIEDSIDAEAMVGGYDCEVNLIIPSGLSRNINPLRKSFAGTITTIGKVKPDIILYKLSEDESTSIQIIESESGQLMKLEGEFITNLPETTKIKIDCENRNVFYEKYGEWFKIDPNCISVDSSFFILDYHFNFENSINCKVTDVIYYEKGG